MLITLHRAGHWVGTRQTLVHGKHCLLETSQNNCLTCGLLLGPGLPMPSLIAVVVVGRV